MISIQSDTQFPLYEHRLKRIIILLLLTVIICFFACPSYLIDLKQKVPISKKKQTTLLDLTKKSLEEGNVLTSAKIKAKKQKTLSEM